jgi:hypothetical protein
MAGIPRAGRFEFAAMTVSLKVLAPDSDDHGLSR